MTRKQAWTVLGVLVCLYVFLCGYVENFGQIAPRLHKHIRRWGAVHATGERTVFDAAGAKTATRPLKLSFEFPKRIQYEETGGDPARAARDDKPDADFARLPP